MTSEVSPFLYLIPTCWTLDLTPTTGGDFTFDSDGWEIFRKSPYFISPSHPHSGHSPSKFSRGFFDSPKLDAPRPFQFFLLDIL